MSVRTRYLGLLAFLCLGAGLFPARAEDLPPVVQSFFAPRSAVAEDGVYANLKRFLDTAEESIHCSLHELDLVPVARMLAGKAASGRDVVVIVEASWWNTPRCRAAQQILEDSRVRVVPDGKASGLMHNKFIVVDGKRVWTGSTNFTENGFFLYPNNAVWIESHRVAENFEVEFQEQLAGKFGKRASGPPNTPNLVVSIKDAGHLSRITTVFGPEEDPVLAAVRQVQRAKKSVALMSFAFSHQGMAEALIAAHRRGVHVRVLLDNNYEPPGATANWSYVPYAELSKANVRVAYDTASSKLHHKTIIVDGNKVITGSVNFSSNAAKSNDENLVIIEDSRAAAAFLAEFDRLWREHVEPSYEGAQER